MRNGTLAKRIIYPLAMTMSAVSADYRLVHVKSMAIACQRKIREIPFADHSMHRGIQIVTILRAELFRLHRTHNCRIFIACSRISFRKKKKHEIALSCARCRLCDTVKIKRNENTLCQQIVFDPLHLPFLLYTYLL